MGKTLLRLNTTLRPLSSRELEKEDYFEIINATVFESSMASSRKFGNIIRGSDS